MDGAVRAEPRPGEPRQDVEAWRASPISRRILKGKSLLSQAYNINEEPK